VHHRCTYAINSVESEIALVPEIRKMTVARHEQVHCHKQSDVHVNCNVLKQRCQAKLLFESPLSFTKKKNSLVSSNSNKHNKQGKKQTHEVQKSVQPIFEIKQSTTKRYQQVTALS